MENPRQSDNSLTVRVFGKALVIALMVIPTTVSIFLALKVKSLSEMVPEDLIDQPQIICFSDNVCAIEVKNKWYRISGIISMDETVPEEYRLNDIDSEELGEPRSRPLRQQVEQDQ